MAGPATDSTGKIEKKPAKADDNLQSLIMRMKPEIERALPRHISPDRMARIALTAVRTNRDLAASTPASFLACLMSCAQLGLEPNTPLGFAYLIPRNAKGLKPGEKECTLIVGYQGMMDLARRSPRVKGIYAYPVFAGDSFKYSLGTKPHIDHVPSEDPNREDPKKLTHVYAVANVEDSQSFVVLTRQQVEARRERSPAKNNGPWVTDYIPMALKSAVRELFKWIPKSAELATAEAIEQATELGRPVSSAVDESVRDVLEREGYESSAAEVVDDSVPALDPEAKFFSASDDKSIRIADMSDEQIENAITVYDQLEAAGTPSKINDASVRAQLSLHLSARRA